MKQLDSAKFVANHWNLIYSQTFDIKRGTPQGDRSSPYNFIICLEILLIKIEMGGGGQIVGQYNTDLRGEQVNSVNEAFADDLTAVFRMSNEAVKCTGCGCNIGREFRTVF
jgi:hypothetical protein